MLVHSVPGIWVHIEGQTSPHFTGSGMVDGTDEGGTLISDLREYLRAAAQRDILIFITLWNGAAKGNTHDRYALLHSQNKTSLLSYPTPEGDWSGKWCFISVGLFISVPVFCLYVCNLYFSDDDD